MDINNREMETRNRALTGNWYLKRNMFGWFKLMVEIEYDNGEEDSTTEYKRATDSDIMDLMEMDDIRIL